MRRGVVKWDFAGLGPGTEGVGCGATEPDRNVGGQRSGAEQVPGENTVLHGLKGTYVRILS